MIINTNGIIGIVVTGIEYLFILKENEYIQYKNIECYVHNTIFYFMGQDVKRRGYV